MAFTLSLTSSASPETVWAVLTDFAEHGRYITATRMSSDDGPPRVGWELVGTSGVGRVGFKDSMLITHWEPPRRFRLVKTGRVLKGWADVVVEPHGIGTRVTWAEQVTPRLAPVERLTDRVARRAFERSVRAMLARAELLDAENPR